MRPFVTTPGASAPAWRPVARTGLGAAAAPALGGLCWAVVAWEARRARSGPRPYEQAHPGDARIGPADQAPVRIAWLGDSLAAGLGADVVDDTPAHLVARMLERAVDVTVLAVPGARAVHVLEEQVPALDDGVDLVVLCVGANDVASSTRRQQYAAELHEILEAVAPIPTVVLSLPDMAVADRMAQPLRLLA
ncbi:MAG: GDSL-type esterase/lipase family protein, partial [Acidimicrobiales bacterium]